MKNFTVNLKWVNWIDMDNDIVLERIGRKFEATRSPI